jgi:hypothetical protein
MPAIIPDSQLKELSEVMDEIFPPDRHDELKKQIAETGLFSGTWAVPMATLMKLQGIVNVLDSSPKK